MCAVAMVHAAALCFGGIRSTSLRIQCGPQREILEVREPHTCRYEVDVTAPEACTAAALDDVRQQLMQLGACCGGHRWAPHACVRVAARRL